MHIQGPGEFIGSRVKTAYKATLFMICLFWIFIFWLVAAGIVLVIRVLG